MKLKLIYAYFYQLCNKKNDHETSKECALFTCLLSLLCQVGFVYSIYRFVFDITIEKPIVPYETKRMIGFLVAIPLCLLIEKLFSSTGDKIIIFYKDKNLVNGKNTMIVILLTIVPFVIGLLLCIHLQK